MRRSEISTANSTQVLENIIIPNNVKEELNQIITTLKNLLKDNKEFFVKLINKCLEVGEVRHVYFNDIEHLLHVEYPNLMRYTDGVKLLRTSFRFTEALCLDSETTKELLEEWNPQTEDDYSIIREQIAHIVYDICNIQEDNNVSITGEIE